MDKESHQSPLDENGSPPFFKTWKRLYAAVLISLALLIILFYIFGKAFQ